MAKCQMVDTTYDKHFLELIEEGIYLKEWNCCALDKDQAIKVAEKCVERSIAISGGDVFELKNNTIEHNYDNWYCNSSAGESFAQYVLRSVAYTISYINNYNNPRGHATYFVFVPVFSTSLGSLLMPRE